MYHLAATAVLRFGDGTSACSRQEVKSLSALDLDPSNPSALVGGSRHSLVRHRNMCKTPGPNAQETRENCKIMYAALSLCCRPLYVLYLEFVSIRKQRFLWAGRRRRGKALYLGVESEGATALLCFANEAVPARVFRVGYTVYKCTSS